MASFKYEPCKKAHVFFYSYDTNSQIKCLLFKQSNHFTTLSTTVEEWDNYAPTFSCARILTLTFEQLFTKEILSKITNKINLASSDIRLSPIDIKPYKLWDEPFYRYWLGEMSQNPIQYDSIDHEVVYFLEIPFIDLDHLNKTLSTINYFTSFGYYDPSIKNSNDVSPLVNELFTKINIDTHIRDTTKIFNEDTMDYYIVLACKKSGNDQTGFFHFPALFTGLYRKNNEKWIYLITSSDPFPDEKMLSKCKCIIIPGSELSVFDKLPFLLKTEEYIKNLIDNINKYPKLRILGICFGLQIILSALGAELDRVSPNDFIKDPVDLTMDDSFWSLDCIKRSYLKPTKTLRIQESHRDYVKKLPTNYKYKNYASSSSCEMEIIVSDDQKQILIQGHPEYSPVFLINRAYDFMMKFDKIEPTPENCNKFVAKYSHLPVNLNVNIFELRQLCYTFMKHI